MCPAYARQPAEVPLSSFSVRLPQDWISPRPGEWTSPDGTMSLCWSEFRVADGDLEGWVRRSQRQAPGLLLGEAQKLLVAGQPAWMATYEYQNRLQRLTWCLLGQRGVVLNLASTRTQSFASAAILHDLMSSFRWRQP